jgi:hypothetical protein
MGAGSRALEGRGGRNQFDISDTEINTARENREDVGVEVRVADTLPYELARAELSGGDLPAGIVAHLLSADQWPEAKSYLDTRKIPHKWKRMIRGAVLNSEHGADW